MFLKFTPSQMNKISLNLLSEHLRWVTVSSPAYQQKSNPVLGCFYFLNGRG